MVDEVEEVLTVTSDQLEDVPTADGESIEAIAKIGDRLVILLNPEGLFARPAPTTSPRRRPHSTGHGAPHHHQARIVVADDSRLMRRMLSDALGRQGFDVVATAADGDEALAACREHRPDALTLDLAMPGLDGIGVLRALRAGRAEPSPVVVVSAFSPAHGARAVDALAEGAFDLVAKPAFGEALDDLHRRARPQGRAPRPSSGRRARAAPAGPRRARPRAAARRARVARPASGSS